MNGYFLFWRYRDGGSFSRHCDTFSQVVEEMNRILTTNRLVEKIEITLEYRDDD